VVDTVVVDTVAADTVAVDTAHGFGMGGGRGMSGGRGFAMGGGHGFGMGGGRGMGTAADASTLCVSTVAFVALGSTVAPSTPTTTTVVGSGILAVTAT
jgi:hypothetical protein